MYSKLRENKIREIAQGPKSNIYGVADGKYGILIGPRAPDNLYDQFPTTFTQHGFRRN